MATATAPSSPIPLQSILSKGEAGAPSQKDSSLLEPGLAEFAAADWAVGHTTTRAAACPASEHPQAHAHQHRPCCHFRSSWNRSNPRVPAPDSARAVVLVLARARHRVRAPGAVAPAAQEDADSSACTQSGAEARGTRGADAIVLKPVPPVGWVAGNVNLACNWRSRNAPMCGFACAAYLRYESKRQCFVASAIEPAPSSPRLQRDMLPNGQKARSERPVR